MIRSIRGIVLHIGEGELTLEVGGIGLRIAITGNVHAASPEIGKPFFLHTYLSVREDELSLYGFQSAEERGLFEVLLGVSGVGPKLALSVLSNISPDVLRSAIANNQPEILTRVPGIGKKTGEKIIFHLKDILAAPAVEIHIPSDVDTEVLGVLTGLGYSLVESQTAVQSIPEDAKDDIEERVRLALQYFSSP
ncbi:MAG: Holliday junction branch migration protein RuvA [Anaerolineales bacterium]|nr:Holliday junction branch migration protein RuvA [Anaerolineales bacterium]